MIESFKKFRILLIVCACFIHANPSVFTYDQALAKCDENNLQIQQPEPDGRTQTLNKKGAVTATIDSAARDFLKFGKGKAILEIGGCYGDVMLQALKQSESTIYALNDMDGRHLFIAAKRLCQKIQHNSLKSSSAKQVKFVQADITNTKDVQKLAQYEAIYVGRVFHFLTPEQFELSVKHLFLLLKPKGRVFASAITPYVKRFERFIPEYERRLAAGEEYPGFVKSLREYVNDKVTSLLQIKNISEEPFLFLDVEVLRHIFERNGFRILECRTLPLDYKSESWVYDGRENVMIIAEKDLPPEPLVYKSELLAYDGRDNVMVIAEKELPPEPVQENQKSADILQS